MARRTPLHDRHREAGARLVDFAGWDMPVDYGSQIAEHHAVRRDAGMFDVSHMTQIDLGGAGAEAFLRTLCANDVARLDDGGALYTCLLNGDGGVVDDGIVYRLAPQSYRLVVNAATRDKDWAWIERHAAGFDVACTARDDQAMIAVQGPNARERAHGALPPALAGTAAEIERFHMAAAGDALVARTGYTGEDGYEIMLPADDAPALWDALATAEVRPAGLGARDTLRLEAGMALYGQEMDEEVSPLEAGLGWTVAWEPADRRFLGRDALERQRAAGVPQRLAGLVLEGRGIARAHQPVDTDAGAGETTSGGYAPTLDRSIALARVPADATEIRAIMVRNRRIEARVAKYPFVRNGRPRE